MKQLIVLLLAFSCASPKPPERNMKTRYLSGCHTLAGCVEILAKLGKQDCESESKKFRMLGHGREYNQAFLNYECVEK